MEISIRDPKSLDYSECINALPAVLQRAPPFAIFTLRLVRPYYGDSGSM